MGGIPITLGYLFLGIVSFFIHLNRANYNLNSSRYFSFLFLMPFQIIILSTLIINGSSGDRGMTVSLLINFFFLPYVFFLLLSQNIETLDLDKFFKLFKKGIYLISIYGIFLFIFKQITGKFIEIPFLTTNLSDFGKLEDKCIDRGFAFKLISTYNNGNLYGICLLILLPLYCYLENSSWKKVIVKTSIFLTLSRTSWAGLLFYELCYNCFIEKGRNRIFKLLIILSFFISMISILLFYYNIPLDFIFDSNLGGRRVSFNVFQDLALFPTRAFEGISEIVYTGILYSFGVIGLITFLMGMTGSLTLRLLKGHLNKIQMSMCLGLVNYLFISCSDGGILYIPVMAFFWFLCSLLTRKNLPEQKSCKN